MEIEIFLFHFNKYRSIFYLLNEIAMEDLLREIVEGNWNLQSGRHMSNLGFDSSGKLNIMGIKKYSMGFYGYIVNGRREGRWVCTFKRSTELCWWCITWPAQIIFAQWIYVKKKLY